VRSMLRTLPCRVVEAKDPETGIRLARGVPPSVILVDIPARDAARADTMAALKADPVTASIPVVAIADDAPDNDGDRIGFVAQVPKPFGRARLIHALDRALGGRAWRESPDPSA